MTPCPYGRKQRHRYEASYVGEDKPARLFCRWCGDVRDTDTDTGSLDDLTPDQIVRAVLPRGVVIYDLDGE